MSAIISEAKSIPSGSPADTPCMWKVTLPAVCPSNLLMNILNFFSSPLTEGVNVCAYSVADVLMNSLEFVLNANWSIPGVATGVSIVVRKAISFELLLDQLDPASVEK